MKCTISSLHYLQLVSIYISPHRSAHTQCKLVRLHCVPAAPAIVSDLLFQGHEDVLMYETLLIGEWIPRQTEGGFGGIFLGVVALQAIG